MSKKILLAIPCYNCQVQIQRVISGLSSSDLELLDKVVLIDNRSTDQTVNSIKKAISESRLPQKFELIQNDDNYGLGGSHKVAFQVAVENQYDWVGILHGDDQASAAEIKILLDYASLRPEFAAILGSRFMRGSALKGYSSIRTWGNRALNFAYTILSGRKTQDMGSGLNLFRVSDLVDRRFLNFSNGFTFNMDLLLDYYAKKLPVLFVPITWSETDQISNAKTFKTGWIALKTVLKWRFGLSGHSINKEARHYSFKVLNSSEAGI